MFRDGHGRVLRNGHGRVFRNGHGRVFRELTTRQELGLERQSVLILFGIEKVKVTDWGFWA